MKATNPAKPARFLSEAILVALEDIDPPAAIGEPGAPRRFVWRGQPVNVARVVNRWRQTRDCTHGSGEQYVFKHFFEVEADDGRRMTIYFERKARSKAQAKKRWWIFSANAEGTAV